MRLVRFVDCCRRFTIRTTEEHPFWVEGLGRFLPAGKLQPGQQFRTPTGEIVWLEDSVVEPHPGGVRVYNVKVAGLHNYFVAPLGPRAPPVLAHNANCAPQSWKAKIEGRAHPTGTPGHSFRTYREAIKAAKDPNVESVHINHGYNRALGLEPKTIKPNRRPDVTIIHKANGNRTRIVRRIEVKSKSDVRHKLLERNRALDEQIQQHGYKPLKPQIVDPTTE